MRIAYLVNQYPFVSHTFIRREIAALEALGAEITPYSIRHPKVEFPDELDRQEAKRTRFILQAGALRLFCAAVASLAQNPLRWVSALFLAMQLGWRSDRGLFRHLCYFIEACQLAAWLKHDHVDHLHAHFATNPAAVAMLCRALGGPEFSFTVHGPGTFEQPELLKLRQKIQSASFVVAVSSYGRAQLYRMCEVSQWDKIHVVHCGVDESHLQAPLTSPASDLSLVCVGRLCEQKGQILLLRAVARLVREGRNVHLTLVGDGPFRPALERLIDQERLHDHVQITGWASSDTVREHLLASRAMVLPSFMENLPVALMEAMAMGRPVVSTFVAAIPEMIISGVHGWLVPPGSIDDLVQALREVLNAPAARLEEMGRAGAARVREQHDVALAARQLLGLFQRSSPRFIDAQPDPISPRHDLSRTCA